jgi:hypothetical protein
LPKTRLISPGSIPNHKLLKNLQLQSNYISNDGDDEGIRINDGGNVGIGVTDPASPLEIFSTSSQLKLSYDATYYTDISVANDGELEIATTGSTSSDITLDSAGDIILDADGGDIRFKDNDTNQLSFSNSSGTWTILSATSDADMIFKINDGGANTEVMRLDGSASSLFIASGKKIEFGNAGENISGDGTDLTIESSGHVEFEGCGVGFDKKTTTFAASAVIGEGDDSTDIDFRLGNKHELTLTDDIAGSGEYINMIFPATSGNFILVLMQGVADCTVANTGWRAYQSDGSTLGVNTLAQNLPDGRVRWAGGSAPTLSTSQYDVDVISFYWDADNGTALGVASLDFG